MSKYAKHLKMNKPILIFASFVLFLISCQKDDTNNQIISKDSKSEVRVKIVDYESGNSISTKPNFETEALITSLI